MKKSLCFLSFDFDLTITSTHTWKKLNIRTVNPDNLEKAKTIPLINAPLLCRLIETICSNGVIFCITTLQYRDIVLVGMRQSDHLKRLIELHQGKLFFIIDRTDLSMHHNKKADALRSTLCAIKGEFHFSGVHFDDDPREAEQFKMHGIGFQYMEPGTGFGSDWQSSLCLGLKDIPKQGFTHRGIARSFPTTGETKIPYSHNFNYACQHSATKPIAGFVSDLLVAALK